MTILQRVFAAMLMTAFMGSTSAAPNTNTAPLPPGCALSASAGLPAPCASSPQSAKQTITPAAVKNELLNELQRDGFLTSDQRSAAARLITQNDNTRFDLYTEDTSWTRHVTWSLALKCLGLLMLFAAMWGWIKAFARHFNGWLRKIPLIVYQSVFITISLAGLLLPERIYPAHAFDLALFCAFSTPLLAIWLIGTNQRLMALCAYFFFNGTVARYLVPALGAAYFLGVALILDSQILGMAAMWFMLSIPYLLVESLTKEMLNRDNNYMVSALSSHLLGAALWMTFSPSHTNALLAVLSVAATYYLPVAISLVLLVAMAPWYWSGHKNSLVFYIALYILLVSASFSDIFASMPAMNSLLAITGIATILLWIVERSFRLGYLFGTFVTGAALYVLSLNIDMIRVWLSTVHFVA